MSRNRRARADIARAVRRVAQEELIPVADLAPTVNASERALVRWIVNGKGNIFLDGVHKPNVGWMSSVEALERFFRACHERDVNGRAAPADAK